MFGVIAEIEFFPDIGFRQGCAHFLVGEKRHKDNLSTDVQQLTWSTWRRRTLRNTAVDLLKRVKKLRDGRGQACSPTAPATSETTVDSTVSDHFCEHVPAISSHS